MKEDLVQHLSELEASIQKLKSLVNKGISGSEQLIIDKIPLLVAELDKIDDVFLGKQKYQKDYLKNWLAKKGIKPSKGDSNLKTNQKLEQAAEYLAENYTKLKEFYESLKRSQNVRIDFSFSSIKGASAYILVWGKLLKELRVIDNIENAHGKFKVEIAELKDATAFINGYWLEILLKTSIADYLKNNLGSIQNFDVLTQLHLSKPHGGMAEFDLLLMINLKVFWFECKSGDIGKYYERFE